MPVINQLIMLKQTPKQPLDLQAHYQNVNLIVWPMKKRFQHLFIKKKKTRWSHWWYANVLVSLYRCINIPFIQIPKFIETNIRLGVNRDCFGILSKDVYPGQNYKDYEKKKKWRMIDWDESGRRAITSD